MSAFSVLSVQSTLSLIAFVLIARWDVAPRLAPLSRDDALVPLLWVNAFRSAAVAFEDWSGSTARSDWAEKQATVLVTLVRRKQRSARSFVRL